GAERLVLGELFRVRIEAQGAFIGGGPDDSLVVHVNGSANPHHASRWVKPVDFFRLGVDPAQAAICVKPRAAVAVNRDAMTAFCELAASRQLEILHLSGFGIEPHYSANGIRL